MNKKLAKTLILDEIFDLTLYQKFLPIAKSPKLKKILKELIKVETTHVKFWQDFFDSKLEKLNFGRKLKLWTIYISCLVFGEHAIHLSMEAIEIYGVRKYLNVWNVYKNTPLANAAKKILKDEMGHEEKVVTEVVDVKISPDKIRDIFLGLNDGLVEILGAVSGFFAAFAHTSSVLLASMTVAVAGAISMAAGVYVAVGSEKEVEKTILEKERFLKGIKDRDGKYRDGVLTSAIAVGIAYLLGSMVPVLPVAFGAKSIWISLLCATIVMAVASVFLSFLSGMNTKKRVATNLVILAIAVSVTYGVGVLARSVLGVNL